MKKIDLDLVEDSLAIMFAETKSPQILKMVLDFLKLKLSSKIEVGEFDMEKFMIIGREDEL